MYALDWCFYLCCAIKLVVVHACCRPPWQGPRLRRRPGTSRALTPSAASSTSTNQLQPAAALYLPPWPRAWAVQGEIRAGGSKEVATAAGKTPAGASEEEVAMPAGTVQAAGGNRALQKAGAMQAAAKRVEAAGQMLAVNGRPAGQRTAGGRTPQR